MSEWNAFTPGLDEDGKHVCYFCSPKGYPPMPDGYTLCARCGSLIFIEEVDPLNERMEVCTPCEQAIETGSTLALNG